jgi:sulfatase modifying factor 1
VEFCKKLSEKEGKTYRLPTEAEWEYACRAGTTTAFYSGNKETDLAEVGWYAQFHGIYHGKVGYDGTVRNVGNKGNSDDRIHPVGQKKPNAWGLYDMHGNVWEWVQDYYSDRYYVESPPVDPKGPATGETRVQRGGGWILDDSRECRAARRRDARNFTAANGFRVTLEVTTPP